MRKIFLMVSVVFMLLTCSSDDGGQNDVQKSFLEKHQGTIWGFSDETYTSYIRFLNNPNIPFEAWLKLESGSQDCFIYGKYSISAQQNNVIIIQNTEDIFETIEDYNYNDKVYDEYFTYRIKGDVLEIEHRIITDTGQLHFSELDIQTRQNVNVEDFTYCD